MKRDLIFWALIACVFGFFALGVSDMPRAIKEMQAIKDGKYRQTNCRNN
jgi:hypothetical protein